MSTKIKVATFATVLTILAVPSVVSAQQGYANYDLFNSTEATSNRSQSQMKRFKAKAPSNSYGSRQAGLLNLPTDAFSANDVERPRGILPRDRVGNPPRGNPDRIPQNATTQPF
jgi:hypothetical protein